MEYYPVPCFVRDIKVNDHIIVGESALLVESVKPYGQIDGDHYIDVVYTEVDNGRRSWARLNAHNVFNVSSVPTWQLVDGRYEYC